MNTNLTKTEKSANCNCEIPQPKGKCSENGLEIDIKNKIESIKNEIFNT